MPLYRIWLGNLLTIRLWLTIKLGWPARQPVALWLAENPPREGPLRWTCQKEALTSSDNKDGRFRELEAGPDFHDVTLAREDEGQWGQLPGILPGTGAVKPSVHLCPHHRQGYLLLLHL
jgi:hypothetical protein